MDAGFDYLFDLSMSMNDSDTDREALREAHSALASMSADCRVLSSVWPAFPAARAPRAARPLAA